VGLGYVFHFELSSCGCREFPFSRVAHVFTDLVRREASFVILLELMASFIGMAIKWKTDI